MKRTMLALAIVFLFCTSLVLEVQLVNLVKANPLYLTWYPTEPVTTPPIVVIQSPIQNQTVNSTATVLNFTITKPDAWFTSSMFDYDPNKIMAIGKLVSYHYVLDRVVSQEVSLEDNFGLRAFMDYRDKPAASTSYSVNLTLAEGKHNITVTVNCASLFYRDPEKYLDSPEGFGEKNVSFSGFSQTVFFDMSLPPNITLSVENAPFYSSGVLLDLVVNKPISRIMYSLDSQDNVTLAGNTTHAALTDLPAGKHMITVYAWDVNGNLGVSENVTFSSPEPFPFLIFVAVTAVLVMVIAAVGIAVFRRHRKVSSEVQVKKV